MRHDLRGVCCGGWHLCVVVVVWSVLVETNALFGDGGFVAVTMVKDLIISVDELL